jgi:uncharacterized surface protein with fasciclin (FAS1) repeats
VPSRTLTSKIAAAGLAALLALSAAACSSDTKDTAATSSDTAAAQPGGVTIVTVASQDKDFSTLVSAVKAAALVDTLNGTGPYTVFAPNNEAFAALPAGTLDELLKPENKEKLASILKYHVVAGKVMAADLKDGQVIKTVEGGTLTVGIKGDKVTLTDESGATVNVVKTDIDAGNGVIHVIDGVLTPKADSSATSSDSASSDSSSSDSSSSASGTIVDVASANPEFSTLVTAVKAADLATTLSGTGPFTVFAPTDEAFAKLPAATVDELVKPENKEKLASILKYHVVAGKVMAADLEDGQVITTVNGDTLTVGVAGGKVTLKDSSGNTVTVVTADVPAGNGVIHAIDGVLMPKS